MTRSLSAWLVRLRRPVARIAADRQGGVMVDFAFVSIMLVVLTFATIEFTMASFEYFRAGEAVRRGTRTAMIVTPVGDISALSPATPVKCKSVSGAVSCTGAAVDAAASFTTILQAMQAIFPAAQAENLEIEYADSGIGDISLPSGVLPFVTVRLVDVSHELVMMPALAGLPSAIALPTMEVTSLAGGSSTTP